MSFNSAIMSIEKFNYADAQAKAIASNPNSGVNNLDIYIPRIDGRYTEDDIKYTFRSLGVGLVVYADFVATKDLETKEIKFYSAFIKLAEWNPSSFWHKQFIKENQTRVQISRSEYWIVLPSKTILVRSKVNTHQLAAYTDELFQNFEKQSKQFELQQEIINLQSKNIDLLLGKLQEQSAEIKAIKNQLAPIEDTQSLEFYVKLCQKEPYDTHDHDLYPIEDEYEHSMWMRSVKENAQKMFDAAKSKQLV
jgi:hypothetical protein